MTWSIWGFHKWGDTQNGWFINVYNGKSYWNGWFRGTPTLGNLHVMYVIMIWSLNQIAHRSLFLQYPINCSSFPPILNNTKPPQIIVFIGVVFNIRVYLVLGCEAFPPNTKCWTFKPQFRKKIKRSISKSIEFLLKSNSTIAQIWISKVPLILLILNKKPLNKTNMLFICQNRLDSFIFLRNMIKILPHWISKVPPILN